MDMITLAMINALKKSGGAGYVEAKTLTYDGNGEGKESYKPATYTYVRAGGIIDPASVTEIAMLHQGNNLVLSASDLTIETPNEHIVSISYMGVPGVYVIDEKNEVGVSAGTYVLSELRYASCVTKIVTETIHPIDPKFLPGVCLPVVELGTVPTEGYTPSAETIAQLDAVSVLDAPIVVKFVGALDTTYTLTMNKASMKIDGIDASVYGGITNVVNVDNYELNIVGVQTQWEVVVSKVSGS